MKDVTPKKDTPKPKRRRWFTWLLLLVLLLGSFYFRFKGSVVIAHEGEAAQALLASSADQLARGSLKRDGDARVNILILGKGGAEHAGGNLTDTIQVLSLDIFNNQAGMMSIPRDLQVKSGGSSGKINAVYSQAEAEKKDSGGNTMKLLVSDITDLTIHYFVVLDFDGFSQLIEVLGGVTVNVENPINDQQYPKEDGSNETEVFKLAAGQQYLDGETALKFVRSRHSTGAEGSDFARSARQQQIVAAVKEKALSAGVLTNPVKLVRIFETLGKHIKTDLSPNDLKILAGRMKDINTDNIQSTVLSNSEAGLLVESNQYQSYSLVPRLGFGKYGDIQQRMHSVAPDPLVKQEVVKVRVVHTDNTKSTAKAKSVSTLLINYGYNVIATEATTENYTQNTIIDYRKDKYPFTINYLQQRFGATVDNKKAPREDIDLDLFVAP